MNKLFNKHYDYIKSIYWLLCVCVCVWDSYIEFVSFVSCLNNEKSDPSTFPYSNCCYFFFYICNELNVSVKHIILICLQADQSNEIEYIAYIGIHYMYVYLYNNGNICGAFSKQQTNKHI